MSRRSTRPSTSSSRQMMIAWKVSGLSHRPAIIVSRPASMRLAMAISPSRESSSTEPISRRYMRTGSSVRSVGSFVRLADDDGPRRRRLDELAALALLVVGRIGRRRRLLALLGLLGLDDVDAHLGELAEHVLDLLGGELLGRQHLVQLVIGDVAALLRELDHPLDGGIGQIEQRPVALLLRRRGLGLFPFGRLRRHARSVSARLPRPAGKTRMGGEASGPAACNSSHSGTTARSMRIGPASPITLTRGRSDDESARPCAACGPAGSRAGACALRTPIPLD